MFDSGATYGLKTFSLPDGVAPLLIEGLLSQKAALSAAAAGA